MLRHFINQVKEMATQDLINEMTANGEKLFELYRNKYPYNKTNIYFDSTPKSNMIRMQNVMYCAKNYGLTPEEKNFNRKSLPVNEIMTLDYEFMFAMMRFNEDEMEYAFNFMEKCENPPEITEESDSELIKIEDSEDEEEYESINKPE